MLRSPALGAFVVQILMALGVWAALCLGGTNKALPIHHSQILTLKKVASPWWNSEYSAPPRTTVFLPPMPPLSFPPPHPPHSGPLLPSSARHGQGGAGKAALGPPPASVRKTSLIISTRRAPHHFTGALVGPSPVICVPLPGPP